MTAAVDTLGRVGRIHLADGVLVQLTGSLTSEHVPALREALLSPFAESCRDVVIDAGEVKDVTESALAVLVASREWAELSGRRLLVSRMSVELDQLLGELDLADTLPGIAPLGSAAVTAVPRPRAAAD
jgi:anti-anti-sigma regulatory factor